MQPFGDGDVGHGEKLQLGDALSPDAFPVLDGARLDSVGELRRSFDEDFGINSDGESVSDFYATRTSIGAGFQPTVRRDGHGHGYALAGSIRALSMASLKMDTESALRQQPGAARPHLRRDRSAL